MSHRFFEMQPKIAIRVIHRAIGVPDKPQDMNHLHDVINWQFVDGREIGFRTADELRNVSQYSKTER